MKFPPFWSFCGRGFLLLTPSDLYKMAAPSDDHMLNFHEFGLDDRLLKAIAKLGWEKPTLIQEKAISLGLEGKDILARARTGSGKTAAYALPIIQRILNSKQATSRDPAIRALILVPSKELCRQAYQNILNLTTSCSRDIKCADISGQANLSSQRPLLLEKPDIVLGTPSRVLAHIQAKNLQLKDSLEFVVVDEADMVFSFGYENDVKSLMSHLPKIYQAFLMSATLSEDVQSLKKMVLHNPVILKLEESQLPDVDRLTQYHIKCETSDKFLLIYTLLKLRLIRGKTIVFVNTIERCYRLKLFLEQFSIPACVLNSELPVNSRCHIVSQFNEGVYNIIIALDENALTSTTTSQEYQQANDTTATGLQSNKGKDDKMSKQKKKVKHKKDKEYGVSRGIDFQNVANVVNFDFPLTVDAYIHRVGRTARGYKMGTALSLVSSDENKIMEAAEKLLSTGCDKEILRPYKFRMEEIEGFRYRVQDGMRAVTKAAVREARLKEIRSEILNSQKLKTYFEDNPRDFQILRHDKTLHPAKVQPHLRSLPEYLVPEALRCDVQPRKKAKQRNPISQSKARVLKAQKRKAEDPLKSFKFKRPGKK